MGWPHEALLLGVPWLDAEHRQLEAVVDELENCIREGTSAEVEACLGRLTETAREHFVREEQQMSRRRYPLLRDHEKAHQRLIWYIEALRRDLSDGSMALNASQIDELWDWVNAHIMCEDRAFSDYIKGEDSQGTSSR